MHGYEFHCSFVCVCAFVGIRWICRQVLLFILNVNVRVAVIMVMWSAGQGELVESKPQERRPGTNASWSNGLLCVLIVIR